MKAGLLLFSILTIAALSISCINSNEKTTLKKGDTIPNFTLKNQEGQPFTISDFIGKKNLVIYFYPKDDTPGCTKEACKFRDDYEAFTDLNAMVIGISSDSPESHAEFATKYNLPFNLLSDEQNEIREAFGVQGNFMGIIPGRVTFIVNKSGIIEYVFDSMSQAEKHVDESIKILKALD